MRLIPLDEAQLVIVEEKYAGQGIDDIAGKVLFLLQCLLGFLEAADVNAGSQEMGFISRFCTDAREKVRNRSAILGQNSCFNGYFFSGKYPLNCTCDFFSVFFVKEIQGAFMFQFLW